MASRSARILIVDDDPADAQRLTRMLAAAGYPDPEVCRDSDAAVDRCRDACPDLIVLDLTRPPLEGVAWLERLRDAIPADDDVSILVVTADADRQTRHRALAAGATDCLSTPLDPPEVALRVRNLLTARGLRFAARRRAALHRSEKLALAGALLAGVAHELNNPLAVVMGQSHLLRESAADPETAQRAAAIAAAAERCARVTRTILALARGLPPERHEVDLNAVIRAAAELLEAELHAGNVDLVLELEPGPMRLLGDPYRLHQVIANLVVNAAQALRRHSGPRRITVQTRRHAEVFAIDVADTGPGVPPELRDRIFKPFFTTGDGMGIGLALCRDIVEQHGGTIALAAEPASGARFTIRLPSGERPAAGPTTPPVATARARHVILVVDDEPKVAELLAETFAADGHEVTVAHDGDAALAEVDRRAYDLVVTDAKMPGMDGARLYQELTRRRPEIADRLIFVTGDRERVALLETTGAPLLAKPFSVVEIRRLAYRMLAPGGGS